jgi:predicted dehydrogenase
LVEPYECWCGRIVSLGIEFILLMYYLTGSKVQSVSMSAMGLKPETNTDNAIITLKFENGSQGVINYFSNGHKAYSKERVEVYSQERVLILDNFRTLTGFGYKGFSNLKTKLDKGHSKQFELIIDKLKNGGESLIPFDEIVNTTKASFAALESMKKGTWVDVE